MTERAATDAGEVRSWLESRAEEMAELVESLVAIDSENPPGRGLGRCGRLLREAMVGLNLSPELIELPARAGLEEPWIVRGSVGDGGKTVYFRIALPLAQRGVPVSGIELSKAMVARLRAKPGGAEVAVTIGDFATTTAEGRSPSPTWSSTRF